jgi:uncharacterized cupin superfamily protein
MTSESSIRPISIDSIEWTAWSDVPNFNIRYKHLTLATGAEDYHVGVAIEELAPGKQTAPFHYHIHEEEHVYVLEGTPTVRLGNERYRLKPGDYVCFPASQKAGHCIINESDKLCRYVIVGENNPNEVSVYPDTKKVLVRALGRRALIDGTELRHYWADENTGLAAGDPLPGDPPEIVLDQPGLKPKPPISESDVPWEDSFSAEQFGGRARHLTHAALGDGWHVGMVIESPAPGKRLCPKHFHMLEEEQAIILEGEVTLLLGDQRHVMRPGDYVCFPAGRKIGHSFLNSGSGPCRYLMIGERNPNEVCVYPDSNKLAVDALRSRQSIFDMGGLREYWDGEA